jgi:hypothetical protein
MPTIAQILSICVPPLLAQDGRNFRFREATRVAASTMNEAALLSSDFSNGVGIRWTDEEECRQVTERQKIAFTKALIERAIMALEMQMREDARVIQPPNIHFEQRVEADQHWQLADEGPMEVIDVDFGE